MGEGVAVVPVAARSGVLSLASWMTLGVLVDVRPISLIALGHFGGPIGLGGRRNGIGGARWNRTLRDRLGIRSCNGTGSICVRIPTLTWNTIGGLGLRIASRRWLLDLLRKRNSAYY